MVGGDPPPRNNGLLNNQGPRPPIMGPMVSPHHDKLFFKVFIQNTPPRPSSPTRPAFLPRGSPKSCSFKLGISWFQAGGREKRNKGGAQKVSILRRPIAKTAYYQGGRRPRGGGKGVVFFNNRHPVIATRHGPAAEAGAFFF